MSDEQTKKQVYDSESYVSKFMPEESIYTDDRRLFHRGEYQYEIVTALRETAFQDGVFSAVAVLTGGTEANFTLMTVYGNIVRLQLSQGDTPVPFMSEMLVREPYPYRGVLYEEKDGVCYIHTENQSIRMRNGRKRTRRFTDSGTDRFLVM